MTAAVGQTPSGNRERLIDAATALLEEHPGEELSLRRVCAAVDVRMPTLYHYFGSKRGLLDAVSATGFERYLALKQAHLPSPNPLDDLRAGWDAHVEWGMQHPAVYALIWRAVPRTRSSAATRALQALTGITDRAANLDQLTVTAAEAAEHVLASCVGVTLFLITAAEPRPRLSAQVRDATVAAITTAAQGPGADGPAGDLARSLAAVLRTTEHPALAPEEQALFRRWLTAIADDRA